jgi:hypothetical protein
MKGKNSESRPEGKIRQDFYRKEIPLAAFFHCLFGLCFVMPPLICFQMQTSLRQSPRLNAKMLRKNNDSSKLSPEEIPLAAFFHCFFGLCFVMPPLI